MDSRHYDIAFEGWLEVGQADRTAGHRKGADALAATITPFVAAGVAMEWDVTGAEIEGGFCYVDFDGTLWLDAENEDEAFEYGRTVLHCLFSPLTDGGAKGDWELGEVEEAGEPKAPKR